MRTNVAVKADPVFTHEGGKAAHITDVQALRRSVLAHFLWEDGFWCRCIVAYPPYDMLIPELLNSHFGKSA